MGGLARGRRPLLVLALVVLLLAIPWLLPQRYFLRVVDLGLVYAVLALGLQLLVDSLVAEPGYGAVLLVARPEADPVPALRARAAGVRLPGDR